MKIHLKDETPVQKSYYSMPKPLHQEVKHYVEDLLNKGWITKSSSNYSSPVVAVRKKDGSLWLSCYCRALNNKTISDRHPLPKFKMPLIVWMGRNRPIKGLPPNIPGPEKSPANCIYYTVGLARMGESPIWDFHCASRILNIYGKLFDWRSR